MTEPVPSGLTIVKGASLLPGHAEAYITFDTLKHWIRSRAVARHVLRYSNVRLLTHRVATLPKPLLTAIVIRSLSRGRCVIEDEGGKRVSVGPTTLVRLTRRAVRDWTRKPRLLERVEATVEALAEPRQPRYWRREAPPAYLRTDLVFGLASGGSVGHTAGVLNNLASFVQAPVFLTTDPVPGVRTDLTYHLIEPNNGFWDFAQLPAMAFNRTFASRAETILGSSPPAFFYHRYSLDSFAGVALARRYGVPLILEYNGSEIWINRNWGMPLPYEQLSERIEVLNLNAADVVVVVSEPMRLELTARGIEHEKILVNPNGVDPERYSPLVDGSAIRQRYGLADDLVVGFIGTFGPWHGAEVLTDAFIRLVSRDPTRASRIRLFMIGDGQTLAACRSRLEDAGLLSNAVFTGRTPQLEGPAHLAACDILVSPHIPNADGTPFFGSPTKLFEYMAMGKPIIASNLDQIGEVLEHGRNAWLVPPGDPGALAEGLRILMENSELCARLGRAARQDAVARHTWQEHTRRIIEKLEERCG